MSAILQYYKKIISQSHRWLRFSAWVFVAGIIAGIASVIFDLRPVLDVVQTMVDDLASLGEQASSTSLLGRIFLIWQNNILAVGMMLFLGFLLGYVPFASLFANGLLLGLLGVIVIRDNHNFALFLLSIVPHGVIEFPVMALSGAWGMKLGWKWLRAPARGRRFRVLNDTVIECIAIFALSAVLLLVAAVIEGGVVFGLLQ